MTRNCYFALLKCLVFTKPQGALGRNPIHGGTHISCEFAQFVRGVIYETNYNKQVIAAQDKHNSTLEGDILTKKEVVGKRKR